MSIADQEACPRCASAQTSALPEANPNDRRCRDCTYEWPLFVAVPPRRHYVDISATIARIAADVRAWAARSETTAGE